jgi:ATP-dependent exoDNAse (exonuclease V) beta subunit
LLCSLEAEAVQVDEEAREQSRDPPRRVWRVVPPEGEARAPAWVVGQLVHGALADWLYPGGEGRDYYTWAAAEARGYGITDEGELKDAVERAAEMLARFRGTALCARMEAAEVRRHEVPYTLLDGPPGQPGQLDKGVIDALFREAEGWTVVEFKTDRVRNEQELEQKLGEADYVEQVGRYLDAGERLLGVRPRPVLCLLNYARTVRLVVDRW